MPDESCRKCGGLLLAFAVCAECRAPIQYICRLCTTKTVERFHDSICFKMVNHNESLTVFPEQDTSLITSKRDITIKQI